MRQRLTSKLEQLGPNHDFGIEGGELVKANTLLPSEVSWASFLEAQKHDSACMEQPITNTAAVLLKCNISVVSNSKTKGVIKFLCDDTPKNEKKTSASSKKATKVKASSAEDSPKKAVPEMFLAYWEEDARWAPLIPQSLAEEAKLETQPDTPNDRRGDGGGRGADEEMKPQPEVEERKAKQGPKPNVPRRKRTFATLGKA